MNRPEAWNDTSLLDDEPFCTEFYVRSTADAETLSRRSTREHNDRARHENIVKQLQEQQDAVDASRRWLKLAFAKSSSDTDANAEFDLVEGLNVFVKFYWRLYLETRAAVKSLTVNQSTARHYLREERSKRRFGYDLPQNENAHASTVRQAHAKPHHRPEQRIEARIRPQFQDPYDAKAEEEPLPEDARDTIGVNPSFNALSIPPFSQPASVSQPEAELIVSADFSTAIPEEASQHLLQAVPVPLAASPVGVNGKRKAATEQPSSSDTEGEAFPHPPSTRKSVEQETDDPADSSPLTNLSDLSDGPTDKGWSESASWRPPQRTASNREALRQTVQRETQYEEQRRRGKVADPLEDSLAHAHSQKASTVKTKRKVKSRPGNQAASVAPPSLSGPPAVTIPAQDIGKGTREQGKRPRGRPRKFGAAVKQDDKILASMAPKPRPARKQHTNKLKPRRSQKKANDGVLSRPAKQRRVNENHLAGDLAFIMLSTGQSQRMSSRFHSTEGLPMEGQDVDRPAAPTVPSPTEIPTVGALLSSQRSMMNRSKGRKRSRNAFEKADVKQANASQTLSMSQRLTIELPKRTSVSSRSAGSGISQPSVPQVGFNMEDVDRNLRNAALDASLMIQASHEAADDPLSDFGDDDRAEGQAELPDSSDDETPLQQRVRSRSSAQQIVGTTTTTNHLAAQPAPSTRRNVPAYVPPPPQDLNNKPHLPMRPPVWAQSRQEVCESFDWFRSYQSGVYFVRDMVKGYLLSAFSSSRDLFAHDGRLIISHGGGKAESLHTKQGKVQTFEADDQLAGDKSVRALLNTYSVGRPVVLLIDDKYTMFPYNLAGDGYTYVVLGFYKIVHAWAEKQAATNSRGYVVRYKFAFQWCEAQGKPWWIDAGHSRATSHFLTPEQADPSLILREENPTSASTPCLSMNQSQCCQLCKATSPFVYAQGWMCLKPGCKAFWKNPDRSSPADVLDYAESFLEILPTSLERLDDIRPPLPIIKSADGITTSRIFCKGWHCVQCGRMSSRYKWEHWECKCCGAQHRVQGRLRDPKEFWGQKVPETFMNARVSSDSGIIQTAVRMYKSHDRHGVFSQFILPQNMGRIILISGTVLMNKEADQIFKEYQQQADSGELLFRRWPLRAHKCRGTLLTNYFSQNSGEPYQYVGGTDNTVPWDAAPSAVCRALDLIQQRMKDTLNMPSRFNEVLSAAYMEKQKMAFHSDSERGLGPTVASLSLGSAAYMYFRPLSKYSGDKGKGSSNIALTLYLRHGDVLVMDGEGIQKYYEHTVEPINFRIAATARSIDSCNH